MLQDFNERNETKHTFTFDGNAVHLHYTDGAVWSKACWYVHSQHQSNAVSRWQWTVGLLCCSPAVNSSLVDHLFLCWRRWWWHWSEKTCKAPNRHHQQTNTHLLVVTICSSARLIAPVVTTTSVTPCGLRGLTRTYMTQVDWGRVMVVRWQGRTYPVSREKDTLLLPITSPNVE